MGGKRLSDDEKRFMAGGFRTDKSIRAIKAGLKEEFDTDRSVATISDFKKRVPVDEAMTPWGAHWPSEPAHIALMFRLLDLYRRELPPPKFKALDWRTAHWALKLSVAVGEQLIPVKLSDMPFPVRLPGVVTETDEQRWDDAWLLNLVWLAMLYADRDLEAKILGDDKPDTTDLDALLEYRCWESLKRYERYRKAIEDNVIPAVTANRILLSKTARSKADRDRIHGAVAELDREQLRGWHADQYAPYAPSPLFYGTGDVTDAPLFIENLKRQIHVLQHVLQTFEGLAWKEDQNERQHSETVER